MEKNKLKTEKIITIIQVFVTAFFIYFFIHPQSQFFIFYLFTLLDLLSILILVLGIRGVIIGIKKIVKQKKEVPRIYIWQLIVSIISLFVFWESLSVLPL